MQTPLPPKSSQGMNVHKQVDVEPLGNFKSSWKPDEPERLDPIFVERTSLRDALAARRGLNPQTILGTVELVEPTFQVASP